MNTINRSLWTGLDSSSTVCFAVRRVFSGIKTLPNGDSCLFDLTRFIRGVSQSSKEWVVRFHLSIGMEWILLVTNRTRKASCCSCRTFWRFWKLSKWRARQEDVEQGRRSMFSSNRRCLTAVSKTIKSDFLFLNNPGSWEPVYFETKVFIFWKQWVYILKTPVSWFNFDSVKNQISTKKLRFLTKNVTFWLNMKFKSNNHFSRKTRAFKRKINIFVKLRQKTIPKPFNLVRGELDAARADVRQHPAPSDDGFDLVCVSKNIWT